MAGKPIGNIFVELDLDNTKYTRSQKQILAEAKTTSLNVEKNWSIIGQKSDLMYDAMRQRIVNAYEMIKNQATSTAQEIVRAEEAKNAKLKAIDDQQFGRQTGFLETLKKNWMAFSAAAIGALYAIRQAWDLVEKAADYEERIDALNSLGRRYQMTGQQIVSSMKEASRGLISMAEAADMAASALNLSLSPRQMIEFTQISERLSDVIGGTIPEAFSRMTVAAASGRTMTLAQLGIIVDLEKTYKDYAKAHDRSTDSLSQAEKQQIRLNVILEEARSKIEALGPSIDSTRDKMDRLRMTVEDLRLTAGTLLIKAFAGVAGAFQIVAAAALEIAGGIFKIIQGIASLTDALKITKDAAEEWRIASMAAFGGAAELMNQALEKFSLLFESSEDVARSMAEIKVPEILPEQSEEDLKRKLKLQEQLLEAIKNQYEAEGWFESTVPTEQYKLQMLQKEAELRIQLQGLIMKQYETEGWFESTVPTEEYRLQLLEKEAEARNKAMKDTEAVWEEIQRLQGEQTKGIYEAIESQKNKISEWKTAWQSGVEGIANIWASNFSIMRRSGESFGDWFKKLWLDIADYVLGQIWRIAINYALLGNMAGKYESGEGFIGIFGKLFGAILGGAGGGGAAGAGAAMAAQGGFEGSVSRPTLFLAGERGRESVSITPEGKGPTGGSPVFNITITAVDARSFVELTERNPQAIIVPFIKAINMGDRNLMATIRRVK